MDRMYRRQRHFYDATRKFYLLGRDRLIDGLAPQEGDRVLELGCGTGRNLICAARRYPQARFFGIDVSDEMLATARQAIARAGLSSRIAVAQGDACDSGGWASWGQSSFERVFMSYSLSMIPQWTRAIESARSRLQADDGELHIVDFGALTDLPRWSRTALVRWLALFDVTPRDELETVLRAIPRSRLRMEPLFRDYARYAVLKCGA